MWGKILEFILRSKGLKFGSVVGGGTGMVALMVSLYGHVDSKAAETEVSMKQYVDVKHELVMKDVGIVHQELKRMNETLEKIDTRLYDLKKSN